MRFSEFETSSIVFNAAPGDFELWPYSVPVAGRTIARSSDGLVRQNYHEHVLILTLSGVGVIEVGNSRFEVRSGDFAWIDTALTYAHGADVEAEWAYFWMAICGHGLNKLHRQFGFDMAPVLSGCSEFTESFDTAVTRLSQARPSNGGAMSALVAEILAKLSRLRCSRHLVGGGTVVSQIAQEVRKELDRAWDIAELVNLSGASQSQLFRRFKAETGQSPMGWLRKERMVLASYLLRTTEQPISQVALRCGYQDPFHFSRDFTKLEGIPPRAYRARFRSVVKV